MSDKTTKHKYVLFFFILARFQLKGWLITRGEGSWGGSGEGEGLMVIVGRWIEWWAE